MARPCPRVPGFNPKPSVHAPPPPPTTVGRRAQGANALHGEQRAARPAAAPHPQAVPRGAAGQLLVGCGCCCCCCVPLRLWEDQLRHSVAQRIAHAGIPVPCTGAVRGDHGGAAGHRRQAQPVPGGAMRNGWQAAELRFHWAAAPFAAGRSASTCPAASPKPHRTCTLCTHSPCQLESHPACCPSILYPARRCARCVPPRPR